MGSKKPVAILRTKGEILIARDMNNFQIDPIVINDKTFSSAKMTDLFGFKLVEGSDYKVIECKFVGEDSSAFYDFVFGKIEEKDNGFATNN